MARIRNVKPAFFRHESLQDLESTHPKERPMLVYAGLWTQCSKNGVFRWSPRSLKLDILPFIDFDMNDTLALLERHGFIIRFTVDNEEYGYIPKFLEHQAISHKEKDAPSTYPDYDENLSRTVLEPFQNRSGTDPDTADIGHRTNDIGHRTNDIGREAPQASPHTPEKLPHGEFGNIKLTDQEYRKLTDRYKKQDVDRVLETMGAWMKSKGKVYKDHYAALLNWIKKDGVQERGQVYHAPDPEADEGLASPEEIAEVLARLPIKRFA